MSQLKSFFFRLSDSLPLEWLIKLSPVRSLFPYHHIVSDEPVPHIENLYSFKNQREFKKDLDYLLKNFRPIDADEVVRCMRENIPLPDRSFLMTFDDGFREIKDIVAPILKEKGVPAVFFVNPGFINNERLYYRCKISLIIHQLKAGVSEPLLKAVRQQLNAGADVGKTELFGILRSLNQRDEPLLNSIGDLLGISFEQYLIDRKPFLDVGDLKVLSAEGFSIGAHSWDHPYYHLLSVEEQVSQTLKSVQFIQANVEQKNTLFSFPHSDKPLTNGFFEMINSEEPFIDVFFWDTKSETGNAT